MPSTEEGLFSRSAAQLTFLCLLQILSTPLGGSAQQFSLFFSLTWAVLNTGAESALLCGLLGPVFLAFYSNQVSILLIGQILGCLSFLLPLFPKAFRSCKAGIFLLLPAAAIYCLAARLTQYCLIPALSAPLDLPSLLSAPLLPLSGAVSAYLFPRQCSFSHKKLHKKGAPPE